MDKRIGFGPRLGAFFLDIIISGFTSALLLLTPMGERFFRMSGEYGDLAESDDLWFVLENVFNNVDDLIRIAAPFTLFTILYWLIEGFMGASPGKMLLGLKIGTEDGREGHINLYLSRFALKNANQILAFLGAVSGSFFLHSLGGLIGFVIVVGCFMVLGQRKQAIHDAVTRTAVFYRRDLVANDTQTVNDAKEQ